MIDGDWIQPHCKFGDILKRPAQKQNFQLENLEKRKMPTVRNQNNPQ